jgi:sugar-specific transcriptional regulator TrmB/DNA-binding CsgD family transcriptional regulator
MGKYLMLESLGLDGVYEEIYLTMVADPALTVSDLVERLGRPEAEIRAGLDQLAHFTLLRPSREEPGALRPVHPARGLAILLQRQEQELERKRQEVESQREDLEAVLGQDEDGAAWTIERLEGLDAVQTRLEQLTAQTTLEVMTIVPGGPQPAAVLEAARPLDTEIARRGLILRSLYQDSMCGDKANLDYARWLTGLGVQIRTAPVVPPRVILLDRKLAVVPLDPTRRRLGAAIVRQPGVVASLITLFEQSWDAARPLTADDTAEPVQEGPTAAERSLLRLLSRGLTDEAVASRLGVSVRTVQRRMESLMARLGSASRFEAGVKAADRGWLRDAAARPEPTGPADHGACR